ncbi:MAG TPA: HU family DNA-binding protein [Phycisphaerales bacterium]|nr:HU family DNA-binding protein [Phycisphaerales bacterium]
MATVTKKELIDRIAEKTQAKRVVVKRIVQAFLDEVIEELARDNRLEFRDFGVFETRVRAARRAQNPKTLEQVEVPAKRTVKFKMGRLMRQQLSRPATRAASRPTQAPPPNYG